MWRYSLLLVLLPIIVNGELNVKSENAQNVSNYDDAEYLRTKLILKSILTNMEKEADDGKIEKMLDILNRKRRSVGGYNKPMTNYMPTPVQNSGYQPPSVPGYDNGVVNDGYGVDKKPPMHSDYGDSYGLPKQTYNMLVKPQYPVVKPMQDDYGQPNTIYSPPKKDDYGQPNTVYSPPKKDDGYDDGYGDMTVDTYSKPSKDYKPDPYMPQPPKYVDTYSPPAPKMDMYNNDPYKTPSKQPYGNIYNSPEINAYERKSTGYTPPYSQPVPKVDMYNDAYKMPPQQSYGNSYKNPVGNAYGQQKSYGGRADNYLDYRVPMESCPLKYGEVIYTGTDMIEVYCRCPDATYGFTCTEGFRNPCTRNVESQFHPADQRLGPNYFIHCGWGIPHLKKCPPKTRWDQDYLTCNWPKDYYEQYGSYETSYDNPKPSYNPPSPSPKYNQSPY